MLKTKVTYVDLTSDNVELHRELDSAFENIRKSKIQDYPLFIDGKEVTTSEFIESRNPADTAELLGRVACGGEAEVNKALQAARRAAAEWRAVSWETRCGLVEKAADIIRRRRYELTAWLVLENGKNRVEALGEIEETADLFSYYVARMREHKGFVAVMDKLSPADTNTSVLRPYGVWAVIAPFNYPYALCAAPMAAALVTGNTVVGKPSSLTPISGALLAQVFQEAGFPAGTVNIVAGSGSTVGEALVTSPMVDGITFTGSYEVGFERIYRRFSQRYPKPCITEMGGKNPAIVMKSADMERAVMGVYRSAFGMGGQKCSACSRVYVHEDIADEFLRRLVEMTEQAKIGDPVDKDVFLGPLALEAAYEDYKRYVDMARRDGKVLTGGEVLTDPPYNKGYFVRPTIVTGLPSDHHLMVKELFVPLLCVEKVRSLDEALEKANNTVLGLTAGFFSTERAEIDTFLDRIEAGVVYVNRAAGATTGAWPGVQPFGGWKGSGSTGKGIGGLYTLLLYMREQSRTITA